MNFIIACVAFVAGVALAYNGNLWALLLSAAAIMYVAVGDTLPDFLRRMFRS